MVQIILNADDFGRSIEHNRAVNDSFKLGLICSASLIVTGKYLQDAIDLMAKEDYVRNVHLHFNLTTSMIGGDPEDRPLTEELSKDSFFCIDGRFIESRGIPRSLSDIKKWKIVYNELVAQYNKFIEVTNGKGNTNHIDFHLYCNLSFPVAFALNVFTRKYKISTVRYIGLHHKSIKDRIFPIISWNPRVKSFPSTNIDFFLSNRETIGKKQVVELYCHPNYKDGVLLDDSPSYLKHERQPMLKNINQLKELRDVEFISWEDLVIVKK